MTKYPPEQRSGGYLFANPRGPWYDGENIRKEDATVPCLPLAIVLAPCEAA